MFLSVIDKEIVYLILGLRFTGPKLRVQSWRDVANFSCFRRYTCMCVGMHTCMRSCAYACRYIFCNSINERLSVYLIS